MIESYHIERITTAQTLPLRQKVLKPFLQESECINPGDDLQTTFHFGLVSNDKILSIATFLKEDSPEIPAVFSYRLRGMATDSEFQGQGCGRLVLLGGIERLQKLNCDLIWCNARENAFHFYEKLGFTFHGPMFEIKDIGPHKVMYKRLTPL